MCEFIAGIEPLHWAIVPAYLMDKRTHRLVLRGFDLADASGTAPCQDKRYVAGLRRSFVSSNDGADLRTRGGSASIQAPIREAAAIKTAWRGHAACALQRAIGSFGMVPLHSRSAADRL